MARIRSKSFWSKVQHAWRLKNSVVCVGLDSDLALLPACVKHDRHPQYTFNKAIIDSTKDIAACYKPNLAFYLSSGVKGLESLKLTLEAIPEDIPVILDCKVGDIGNTMQAYVSAFFDEMGTDAITVNPLMGFEVISPVFNDDRNFAFALTLTSNPSATDFLLGKEMYRDIADWINKFDYRQLGAVVGATQSSYLSCIRELLPKQLFLIPGIGAQGGDLNAVLNHAIVSPAEPSILINNSRGIIFRDSSERFADTARQEVMRMNGEIATMLKAME